MALLAVRLSPAADGAATHGASRAAWLDVGRGVAIVAMVIYHGAFDLLLFGFVDWPVDRAGPWRVFAASIASSFLFLSGVSLVYAHGRGIRWRPFLRRLLVLSAAAAAVTIGTAVAMPVPIYFGILHAIALFSVLALPFLFAPPLLTVAAAVGVLVLPALYSHPVFEHPVFYPVGLAPVGPVAFDYEPIFPWLGALLLGVAAARWLPRGAAMAPGTGALAFMGRHSLVIYLVHQPVLFALLTLAVQLGLTI